MKGLDKYLTTPPEEPSDSPLYELGFNHGWEECKDEVIQSIKSKIDRLNPSGHDAKMYYNHIIKLIETL